MSLVARKTENRMTDSEFLSFSHRLYLHMQRLCCHMYTVVLLLWAKNAYTSPATCNHVPWCRFLMPCIIAPFTLALFIHFLEWHRVVSVQTSSSEYNDLLMSLRLRCTQSRWSLSQGLQTRRLPPSRESLRKSLRRYRRQHHNQVIHQLFYKLNKDEFEEEVEQIPWDEIQMCRLTRVCLRFIFCCVRVQMSLI